MLTLTSDIYSAAGIRSAIGVFVDFGAFEWTEVAKDGYFSIDVTAGDDVDFDELIGEFTNFALAHTIESGRGGGGS